MADSPKVEWPASKAITTVHHAQQALDRLLFQFRGSLQPNIQAIIQAVANQLDDLEQALLELCTERTISGAVGVQLDLLGGIVGETRRGRDDDDYRVAIIGQAFENKANARVEDILDAFTAIFEELGIVTTFELLEPPDTPAAQVRLVIEAALTTEQAVVLSDVLAHVRGAGISSHLIYGLSNRSLRLKFAPGSAPVASARGLGNAAQTTGGRFSGIVS